MPNLQNDRLNDSLTRVIRACEETGTVRACLLTTRDREHALNKVRQITSSLKAPLYHFTVAGRRRHQPERLSWELIGSDAADAYSLIIHAQELHSSGVVVFEDCIPFFRDEGGDLRARMALALLLADQSRQNGLLLIFMEPPESASRLPSILAEQFVRLEVPYPRMEELELLAREEIALAAQRSQTLLEVSKIQSEAKNLASGVVGLTYSAARDNLRDAMVTVPMNFSSAFERLQDRKKSQLSRELAMNVLETRDVETPIGLDYLVRDLQVMRDNMRLSGASRARGIILIGPPGTGKTMIARAIGNLVDLPVVEFRISSLMNSLLGETERRFSQAFSVLETLSPNVVFIDEIEKAFGDSSERDGGTMMRCTGALLSWLSDNPYPNFIVATSNSLRRMGEIGLTMTRSERFDNAYFVDVPSLDARHRMLHQWLNGHMQDPERAAGELSLMTEKFSGADLRSVVKRAQTQANYAKVELGMDLMKSEVDRKRMRAMALYDEFQDLRRWGRLYCDPAGPMDR
jgi:SpoVK/Ycf46/Vps4 family AAA+-type ATPase